ncbi:MAG: cupin domain-containing protein, partial [Patescibacteria group bacterium]
VNSSSDAFYYVIEGAGDFHVNGETVSVQGGDLVFIPRGTPYFDSGNMRMIAFNSPRFQREDSA